MERGKPAFIAGRSVVEFVASRWRPESSWAWGHCQLFVDACSPYPTFATTRSTVNGRVAGSATNNEIGGEKESSSTKCGH